MRRCFSVLVSAMLFAPFFAFAASSVPAGFAPGAVWLSKSDLTDGQTVQLYTVLYDSASSAIAGNISFLVDNSSISSQPFELAAGTTKIVSASWNAAQGTHEISASLDGVINKDTGEALTLGSAQASPVSVTVAPPPPPSPAVQAAAGAMSAVQTGMPIVTQVAQNTYNSLEYLRQNAVNTLEGQLASASKTSSQKDPEVLGTSTENVAASASAGGFDIANAAQSLWRVILSFLLYIAKTQLLFYATLAVVIYILYKLLRTILFENRHPFTN